MLERIGAVRSGKTMNVITLHLLVMKLDLILVLSNIAGRLIILIALLLNVTWRIFSGGFLLILGGSGL